ncbi:hypothetical protein JYK14_13555 [Siccirubricoccus sp. KC 17139]|uniref:Uncharacterized protein n=1 Tax=Siccirubricoccus soli TaxID=2899147 RepID=A0ABT1D5K7_9PROT|nr:hypothetical protein [Siccirubricoccus soli]MCO6417181.1 hypothetical protein [Siccirubricoccus soli]MCP2683316.1 hypothetical protein [Siccirubricoccus soli]
MTMVDARKPGPEAGQMPEGGVAGQTAQVASDVRGMVDNATADRIYGWAWDAAYPGYRVPVELRLAGEVVASTVADFARPDLAANGIGDGCHAFEFPLTAEWFERRGELSLTGLGADGRSYPVTIRLRRPDDTQVATQLQRAVEAMAAEQKEIRAEHAALRARAETLPEVEAVAAIARDNTALHKRLDELELWIARLDSRLADAAAPEKAAAAGGHLDPWQAALIALLASAVSAALAAAAAGYWS